VNPERALARRNIVLQAMVNNGVLAQADADAARNTALHLTNAIEMKESFGLYYKEQVRRELVDRFGGSRVAQGGLRVYTTLEPELQQAAEKILENGIADIEGRRGYKHPRRGKDAKEYLQGALVAMDPTTGAVRAMVGGRDFSESRFNRAMQAKRQSGSAFKPFVYAAALEEGYSPASLISNLNSPILTTQGNWVPEDGHSNATELTMRSALKISSNRAAVQMLNTIGIKDAVSYAEKLNVGTPPSVPSLALGSGDVTLISLTAAYGAFADHGIVRTPVLIRKVEDSDGKVIYQDGGKSQQAVSDATAFLMSSMLADVISAGTAYKARQAGFMLPAAGKTGTTNDYVDAWFVGYTPHLVTGVWVGFDQPKTIITNGYAADLAVPIWGQFMKIATRNAKPEWFDRPANVIGVNVCRVSGKLPNYGCSNVQTVDDSGAIEVKSMVYTDYFVKGTQPTTTCPVHTTMFGNISAGASPSLGNLPGERATMPTPPPQATSGASPAPAAPVTGGTVESKEQKAEQPKKKGFWRRLFGGGGDDKKDDKKADDKKSKDKKGPGGA
jgi:membrane carboxypeptidase/penicillin-binding protein